MSNILGLEVLAWRVVEGSDASALQPGRSRKDRGPHMAELAMGDGVEIH